MPDGSLRPTSEFSFRQFSGDKYEAKVRYPEGSGTVRAQTLPEARALTQKAAIQTSVTMFSKKVRNSLNEQ